MRSRIAALALAACIAAAGAVVPRYSLERLVDESSYIVQGRITGKRVAWERGGGRFIWTHYQIKLEDVLKGAGSDVVEVSVPGGILDGVGMRIAGTVSFAQGEEVLLFLERTPLGYLRATGYWQGKYTILRDPSTGQASLHGDLSNIELVDPAGKQPSPRETSIESVNGASLDQFKARIRALAGGSR